ncbi:MAG: hypothetical protein NC200_06585 [Candidatus Gastranaerophilales bacterium]|nr:hypothetical protein [Candidatus Gastranaerophilales bacterium]
MGMAASQARYLTLAARKTNTEYEGQQINQERTVLANRTADLFNQMLATSVPTCPDSNDFTTLQYSWSDGYNDSVLSDYYQLGTADEEYNYVVTSYHYEDVYTGQRRLMNDPKVQSSMYLEYTYDPASRDNNKTYTVSSYAYDSKNDQYILTTQPNDSRRYLSRVEDDGETRLELDAIYGRTFIMDSTDFEYDEATQTYTLSTGQFDPETGDELKPQYTLVDMEDPAEVQRLKDTFKFDFDINKHYYYNADSGSYIIGEDIEQYEDIHGGEQPVTVRYEDDGSVYYTDGNRYTTAAAIAAIDTYADDNFTMKNGTEFREFYDFTYVGNCKLHLLTAEDYKDKDIQTELQQIIKDMRGENGNLISAQNLEACFDPNTGEYLGGIYSFKLNGQTYYTTDADLAQSAESAYYKEAYADNGIDSQLNKLPYYKAVYLNTKIEETSKALLETDGKGRFTSVRFEDDSLVYTLNTETITDEAAYQDAMNQYFYKQEKYDKAIRDINAKTELIQAQDRTLELRLKQLDTEQNALQTEMEAVKKVISKNVETSFKTFSGG